MPTFTFTARDGSGTLSTGSMVADSISAAVESLRAEGKYPTSLAPAESAAPKRASSLSLSFAPRFSRRDLVQFVTQLQIMIETGVTLSEAMESIASQSHKPHVAKIVADLAHHVSGGDTFSSALQRHPRSFPRLLVALVAASEKSGMMSKLLGRAVHYLRDEQDTIRRVRGAITYPAIMMAFALSTTIFLMTFILPKFTAIYAAKGAALPILTRWLMSLSDFLIGGWLWLILGMGGAGFGIWQYVRTPSGHRLLNYIQLQIPVFGPIFKKLHLSRGLRMIGTMASSGISLPDCVKTAHDLCPNVYFQELWDQVSRQIQAGKQFSEALFQSPLVPKSMAQMLHSAEKGGKLAHVMEQVSGFAETELKEQIVEMTRYIEPAMIMMMGGIIGTVALALMLPIFTISKVMVK
jgi:type IV pilus assembly protein PilC